jgi:formyl-CoA transferase
MSGRNSNMQSDRRCAEGDGTPAAYAGVRVLDFTQYQQGPIATQVLADFGAEVIKIERPGTGDGFRGSNLTGTMNVVAGGYGPAFLACNRNKKSLALNLKHPRARGLVYALAEKSDVVVSNFRPGVMEKLGLGYEDLNRINPGIICSYATGYGRTGPDRETLGQDMMGQCRAGLVRGDPPHTCGFNVCDQIGGLLLAQGIMAALAARERTGRGQTVDTNLFNAGLVADTLGATAFLNADRVRPRNGGTGTLAGAPDRATRNPMYALYRAKDGRWVHIIDAFRDRPLERQCQALGIPESVARDPRFADVHNLTPEAYEELKGHLAAGVARFTAEEVVARFKAQDMMAVPVSGYRETFDDPQVRENDMMLEAQHPVAGRMRLLGFPVKLSDTPAALRRAPPLLGEHNEEVLGGLLGMSAAEIEALKKDGVM